MASSCGGGLVSNLCNAQPSPRASSSMMSSGSGSESHLVSRPSPWSPRSQSSFLPTLSSNFSTQLAVKSAASRRVRHITASGGSSLRVFPPITVLAKSFIISARVCTLSHYFSCSKVKRG